MSEIKTTHGGSLPRPESLVNLMWDKLDGRSLDEAALAAEIRDAVVAVVARQREVGIDIISDGEMSKSAFHTYVSERVSGFEVCEYAQWKAADIEEFPGLPSDENLSHLPFLRCLGPLEYVGQVELAQDLENLKAATVDLEPESVFVAAVTPGTVVMNMPNEYYGSYGEYMEAITAALKVEYEAIIGAGFTLQLDGPDLALAGHLDVTGTDLPPFKEHLRTSVECINSATAGIDPGRMRLHLCWGNYPGPHHRDTPISEILESVLTARPAGLSFEASNPRHEHEWTVFRDTDIPEDKILIPGLIDTATQHIEHPELIAQRLRRFADIVGRDRVIAGTDCGLSTAVGSSTLHPGVAWAKLASLVEGAALV